MFGAFLNTYLLPEDLEAFLVPLLVLVLILRSAQHMHSVGAARKYSSV
jgi:hypothetical protein